MLRTGRKWLGASVLAALLMLPGLVWGASFDYDNFHQELGLRLGYGWSDSHKGSVNLYSLLPSWGIFIIKPNQSWKIGLSFVVEGIVSVADANNTGFELGFTPMLKLRLPLGTAAMFFIEGGAGMITESFDSPAVAHAFNFTPQVGAGLDIALTSQVALSLAYRWRHSSNAGIYAENYAFNVNFVQAGLAYYY